MAYTSIHSIKATDWAAIHYITDGDKTVNGLYVQSYACRADSRGASEDFRAVRANGTGRTTILAHHIIQSFAPNEVTPEQALQIGEELCDKFLKGDYQYVLAVHTDKSHTHCHIIFNNINLYNGLSFTTEHNQGKVSERSWAKLRKISDDICQEHGLSVIEPKGKGVSHFEHDMQIQGKSWKDKLRAKIAEVAFYSKDFEDFFRNCTASGIEYVYKPQNKVKLKFRLKDEGQQKFTRADTLGEEFTPERIAEQIAQIQKSQSTPERLSEKKNSELEPIESQPTEKSDMWAEIRGMRDSDKMIADLEKGGIKSLSEFKKFMWNVHHDDDHTDELANLKTRIKAIDKLIAKLKQRSEHSAVYKEYQECSALWRNIFRKKNSDAIDSYEQADKYIKEHIKSFYVDGKPPKRSELETLSNDLKIRYNRLVPEHTAFLAKKTAAMP
ncbi:MAG: relaxase/mobilization nuclease domain-containing protein, partial [Oscillospiraceae bacterium]|nr:relaxase/mobilization nuclease domain-containing protein [Oscillospiraceae bacterium]